MGSDEPAERLAREFPQLEAERFAALADEALVHRVLIARPFWLGRTKVTVGQFRAFVSASGHVPESVADGTGAYGFDAARAAAPLVDGDAFVGREPRWSWENRGFAQGEDHPVVNVTWHDAVAMAAWLSRREGRRYRLPTEAEWEYACRAGTRTRWHKGDDAGALAGQANVFDLDAAAIWPRWATMALALHDGWRFTAAVGQFAANDFGLHDMHGNVFGMGGRPLCRGRLCPVQCRQSSWPGQGPPSRASRRFLAQLGVLHALRLPQREHAEHALCAARACGCCWRTTLGADPRAGANDC